MTTMTEPDTTGDILRDTATRVFMDCCGSDLLRSADGGQWPAAAWNAVSEAGLHRALLPETAGGYGVAIPDALSLLRVAAERAVPLPLAETMMAHWLLAASGLEVPEGPMTVGPTDTRESLTLTEEDGAYRVRGSIGRVPWGRDAHFAAVVAMRGTRSWVALLPSSAWTWTGEQNIAREPRDRLTVDGLALAAGPSPHDATTLRAVGAAMRTQQIAGALTGLTAMTVRYAQDRIQFGRPIGKFQAVQQNLAVLAAQAAAATAAADLAAEAVAAGVRILPIAVAKSRGGEAAGIGAGIAHQVHGAIGFTFEYDLQFLTRRLWSWRDEFGNETVWNRIVGRHLAKAGADRLWTEIVAA